MTADAVALARPREGAEPQARKRPDRHDALTNLTWPLQRLADGLAALASATALHADARLPNVPESVLNGAGDAFEHWLDWASGMLALEVEEVEAGVADLGALLEVAYPAIVRVRNAREPQFVLVVARRGANLIVLSPTCGGGAWRLRRWKSSSSHPTPHRCEREIDKLLDVTGVNARRRPAVSAAMARAGLGTTQVDGIWVLRRPPSAPFAAQLKSLRLPLRLAGVTVIMVVLYGLEILAWGISAAASSLAGSISAPLPPGRCCWCPSVPVRGAAGWLNARMAADFGSLLKGRLLAGALRLDPEVTRRQGAGHLLARVMQSQAFEALAIAGGLSALVAVIELGFAFWLLASGAGGTLLAALLAVWTGLSVVFGLRFFRSLDTWTGKRLDLTHGLIERMVGHRTSSPRNAPHTGTR